MKLQAISSSANLCHSVVTFCWCCDFHALDALYTTALSLGWLIRMFTVQWYDQLPTCLENELVLL